MKSRWLWQREVETESESEGESGKEENKKQGAKWRVIDVTKGG